MLELDVPGKRETRHRSAMLSTGGLRPNYQRTVSRGAFPSPSRSVSPPRLAALDKRGIGYTGRPIRPALDSLGDAESLDRARSPSPSREAFRYKPGEKYNVFKPKERTRTAAFQEQLRLASQSNDLDELMNIYSAALDLDVCAEKNVMLTDRYELEKILKRIRSILKARLVKNMHDDNIKELRAVVREIDRDPLMKTLAKFSEYLQAKGFLALTDAHNAVQAVVDAFGDGRGVGVIPQRVQKQKLLDLEAAIDRAKKLQLPQEKIDRATKLLEEERKRMEARGQGAVESDTETSSKAVLKPQKTFANMELAVEAATKEKNIDHLQDVVAAAEGLGVNGGTLQGAQQTLQNFQDLVEELRELEKTCDTEGLEDTIEEAERAGMSCEALDAAKEKLQRLWRVQDDLEKAVRDSDVELVRPALAEADEMGMEGKLIEDARHLAKLDGNAEEAKGTQAKLADQIEEAIESRRLSSLQRAIRTGKDQGARMPEIFKAERVLTDELEFLKSLQADIDKILDVFPIQFAPGKETLTMQDRCTVQKIAHLIGTFPETISYTVNVFQCSPEHKNGRQCPVDDHGVTGNRAKNLKSSLCCVSARTNIDARGWGCQHPFPDSNKLVRIMPTELQVYQKLI